MWRPRLLTRVVLIVAVALFATQVVALVVFIAATDGRKPLGEASPRLPRQIAALVALVDGVPADLRPTVLAAYGERGRALSIVPALPPEAAGRAGVLLLERGIAAALAYDGVTDREVTVLRQGDGGDGGERLGVYVGLAGGGYLNLDVSDQVTVRLLGVPVGFFAGIFGVVVALAAFVAVAREMRPLSRLAREVDRIGEDTDPVPVAEAGAPEVRAVVRAVNAMQERIAELVRSRTLTLGATSHDLRTSLTRLRLRLEMMPESRHRAGAIADVEGMNALIEEALDFAAATSGPTERAEADLAAIVEGCAAGQAAAERIVLDLPDDAVPVAASGMAVERIATNLIENALRYAGSAFVHVARRGAVAELVVEDDGPGIPPEERARVFEPFYRIEASRNRDSGGTGLGLTIVRRIAERHGGTVTLGDSPRGGLAVRVTLPAVEGDAGG